MRKVDAGETFVITRNRVPVGELRPLHRRRFVSADAAVGLFRGAPAVDQFRTDLDRAASQDSTPRT